MKGIGAIACAHGVIAAARHDQIVIVATGIVAGVDPVAARIAGIGSVDHFARSGALDNIVRRDDRNPVHHDPLDLEEVEPGAVQKIDHAVFGIVTGKFHPVHVGHIERVIVGARRHRLAADDGIAAAAIEHIGIGLALHQVIAGAAVERVIADRAEERVVALVAINRIIAVRAGQRVVADAAVNDVIAIAAIAKVIARAAIDDVVVQPAIDRVIARVAVNDVIACIAAHIIVAFAAMQDVVVFVALHGVVTGAAQQAVFAGAAIDEILARAAIDRVIARARDDAVIIRLRIGKDAVAAVDDVALRIDITHRHVIGPGGALNETVPVAAVQGELLDLGKGQGRTVAEGHRPRFGIAGGEQHIRHAGCDQPVVVRAALAADNRVAAAAIEGVGIVIARKIVGTAAAGQHIIARTAIGRVIARASGNRVIAAVAVNGVIAGIVGGGSETVIARAQMGPVIARPARNLIVARTAIDDIIARTGIHRVMARTGQDQVVVADSAFNAAAVTVVDPVAVRVAQIAGVDQIIAARALHDAVGPRGAHRLDGDIADIGIAVGIDDLIGQGVAADIAIGLHRHRAVGVQRHLLAGREGHRLTRHHGGAVDLGDGQSGAGIVAVIGQNVEGAGRIGGKLDRIVIGQRIGLDAAAHDHQVGIIDRIARIGDADLDRVHLPRIYRRLERQNDGKAVHLGVVGVIGVRMIEVRVRQRVHRVD